MSSTVGQQDHIHGRTTIDRTRNPWPNFIGELDILRNNIIIIIRRLIMIIHDAIHYYIVIMSDDAADDDFLFIFVHQKSN